MADSGLTLLWVPLAFLVIAVLPDFQVSLAIVASLVFLATVAFQVYLVTAEAV